jgi:hypothetical protein
MKTVKIGHRKREKCFFECDLFDARPIETQRRRHPNESNARFDTPAAQLEQRGTP